MTDPAPRDQSRDEPRDELRDQLRDQLRTFTFGLPEAWEDHPWGESVAKVGKKVFVFFGMEQPESTGVRLGVKLPESHEEALALPFAEPMGYGLDRGHWVWISAPADAPAEMLTAWIEESYRAVAPRKLVAGMKPPATRPPARSP
ncbi:MAG: MmcQ/YjbR family DNA-binding protein [Candidatus Limnocylindria bacterium]